MIDLERWHEATVTERQDWSEGLFTITLDESLLFEPGQFVRIGLAAQDEPDGVLSRAYSIASAPGEPLAFFVVRVDDGALTPRVAALRPGDGLLVSRAIAGAFTLQKVPEADTLWLVATGTGLGPYISMLRHGAVWTRFKRVVLVHGVRRAADLAYADELRRLAADRPLTYLPATTREEVEGALYGRLPDLLTSGALDAAGGTIDPTCQVMLCGNPDMVNAVRTTLADRGMLLHTPRRAGHVHVERYW